MLTAGVLSEPVAAFHDLLERHEADAVAQFDTLQARLQAKGMLYSGQPLPTSLRPRLLTVEQMAMVRRDGQGMVAACEVLEKLALQDPERMRFLSLPPDEVEVVRYDAAYAPRASFSRLDGFLQSDRVVWVEFNVDSPGGAAFYDAQAEVFLKLPLLQEFQKRYRLRTTSSRARILNVLLTSYRRMGGTSQPPHVAIVDWENVSTALEFVMLQTYFEKRGIPTRIVDPRHVSYRKGHLYCEDFRIDIAYKRVVTRELLDARQDCSAFLNACRDGVVCLVNPFRAKVQTVKSVLAAFWSPDWQRCFKAVQLAAIRRCVPWTARVEEGSIERDGRTMDLLAYMLKDQTNLVIKPNDEYGGAGVTLGWMVTPAEWEARLVQALQTPHVVQERVTLPVEPFPVRDGNRMVMQDFYVDCDPYYFDGRMGSVGTRFSAAAVLNVKTGGGVVPTFVAEPR